MTELPPTPGDRSLDQPRILYEDENLLAISKPAAWHVFPIRNAQRAAVWTWLADRMPELAAVGEPRAPAFVHRLDHGTSGVMLAARDQHTYQELRRAFQERTVEKDYLALVEGRLAETIEIDLPLGGRYRRSRKVLTQTKGRCLRWLRPASTVVYPLAAARSFSLCRVRIITGVRHQIRAHLSHVGHPVAGDRQYGATFSLPELVDRLFLHAWIVKLEHPIRHSPLRVVCALPESLCLVVRQLGIEPPLEPPIPP